MAGFTALAVGGAVAVGLLTHFLTKVWWKLEIFVFKVHRRRREMAVDADALQELRLCRWGRWSSALAECFSQEDWLLFKAKDPRDCFAA